VRLGTAILLAAVVGLLAVGCSSGAGAQPTTLPSITPSQSPVVATVPPQAAANTSQALDAFVRFYFQQLNVAFSTSDASIIRRFSDSRCVTCNNYARGLEADRNAVIRGDSFLLASVAAPPIQASVTMVEVLGSVPPRALVNRDGTLIKSLPTGGQFRFSVSVIRVTEAWRVLSIARGT
jgi:hypothetical protein